MWVSQQLKLYPGLFGLEIIGNLWQVTWAHTVRFVTVCKVKVFTCFVFILLSHTRHTWTCYKYTWTTQLLQNTNRDKLYWGWYYIFSLCFLRYIMLSVAQLSYSLFLRMNWISQTRTGKPCLLCLPRRNGKSIAARRRWVLYNIINNLRFSLAVC